MLVGTYETALNRVRKWAPLAQYCLFWLAIALYNLKHREVFPSPTTCDHVLTKDAKIEPGALCVKTKNFATKPWLQLRIIKQFFKSVSNNYTSVTITGTEKWAQLNILLSFFHYTTQGSEQEVNPSKRWPQPALLSFSMEAEGSIPHLSVALLAPSHTCLLMNSQRTTWKVGDGEISSWLGFQSQHYFVDQCNSTTRSVTKGFRLPFFYHPHPWQYKTYYSLIQWKTNKRKLYVTTSETPEYQPLKEISEMHFTLWEEMDSLGQQLGFLEGSSWREEGPMFQLVSLLENSPKTRPNATFSTLLLPPCGQGTANRHASIKGLVLAQWPPIAEPVIYSSDLNYEPPQAEFWRGCIETETKMYCFCSKIQIPFPVMHLPSSLRISLRSFTLDVVTFTANLFRVSET